MAQNWMSEHDFAQYLPQGWALATSKSLGLLLVVFGIILLHEILTYDWKFSAERREVEDHLILLASLS